MKAYKGFTPQSDGTRRCRDKVYEIGEAYEEDHAVPCSSGMHACLSPIDVLTYYPPASSVYHEVEVGDDAKGDGFDSKVASKTLKVGAPLGISGIMKAQIEYVTSQTTEEEGDHSTGYQSTASATGDYGAASSTGDYGAASSTGDYGAASSTGHHGAASSTGHYGAASSTGDYGAASSTGYYGAASATGDYGAASSTGYRGAASSTGHHGAASATGQHSVALAGGYRGRARGSKGSALMLVERSWTGGILHAQAVIVGKESNGNRIKPNVYYTLVDGKVVEAADQS